MNRTFRFRRSWFLLVLCLLAGTSLHAQDPVRREKDDATMRQATLLFEGLVVTTTQYLNADSNQVFRSSEVRITKTLRGHLNPGTVQVAYPGFRFIQKRWDKQRGETVYLVVEKP